MTKQERATVKACAAVSKKNLIFMQLPFEVLRREIEMLRDRLRKEQTLVYMTRTEQTAIDQHNADISMYDALLNDLNEMQKAFLQLQTTAQLHHRP
jgi:hypothetical protein